MRGSEKQIKWANEIKDNLLNLYHKALPLLPEAERQDVLDLIGALEACQYAGHIIDAYGDIRFSGDVNKDARSVGRVHGWFMTDQQRQIFGVKTHKED